MTPPKSRAALSLANIAKSYGAGPKVLDDVSLAVHAGELLGIIGPNGSGKTTLFGVISGQLFPNAGSIALDGFDVTRLPASARACKGVGRTFQVPQSFTGMTVFENVLISARFAAGLDRRQACDYVAEILDSTGFSGRADALAESLPLLDRKRLELARALATAPRVLLLDEIAGGLTDDEAQAIASLILSIQAKGMAIIWIEHLVHILTKTVSRLVVLGEGRLIADGDPLGTMSVPAVRQLYLGIEPDQDALGS
jgi:branched-chain amino acid transport system ATP-binding protein